MHFAPEQEATLSRLAAHRGTDTEHLVRDAALLLVRDADEFRAAVQEGIEQDDRGELIDDEAVNAWLEDRERS